MPRPDDDDEDRAQRAARRGYADHLGTDALHHTAYISVTVRALEIVLLEVFRSKFRQQTTGVMKKVLPPRT